jgi:predicted P-loop ATPase
MARELMPSANKPCRLGDVALDQLGLADAIGSASSIEELTRITFDADSTEVILIINEAKHPADGNPPADHFDGLSAAALKKILTNRFKDLTKDRQKQLLGGGAQADESSPDWTEELLFNKEGKILGNVANMTLIFRHHLEWKDVLAYSEFSANIISRKQPPWGAEQPDTPWTKEHTTKARVWLLRNGMANAAKEAVIDAVEAVAKERPFHPVRDYFESLVWDGVPRLENWLQTYYGVKNSEYARVIGPRFPISSVARIYLPGAKVDHVLVLEGPQGRKKKSQMVEALVPNEELVGVDGC